MKGVIRTEIRGVFIFVLCKVSKLNAPKFCRTITFSPADLTCSFHSLSSVTKYNIRCLIYSLLLCQQLHGAELCLDKLTVAQLVKQFPVFYGNRRLVNVFTTAPCWSPSKIDESTSHLTHYLLNIYFTITLIFQTSAQKCT